MATYRHQRQHSRGAKMQLCALAASVVIASVISIVPVINSHAQEPGQEIEAPDNWYQVEVILFTQNGNIGGETPPQDYDLSFPETWLELIDPNMPMEENGFPLAQGSLLYKSSPGDSSRTIPMAILADPLNSNGLNPEQPAATEEEQYIPQYEAPFVLLDKQFRDLNDSAAALDRRQYNVVFHEAWRFAAAEDGTDPWVLIKAGQSLEGRFQLEGSLRFYKSRFLHFQSNLWLLEFANASADEPSRLIDLPAFPVAPISPELTAITRDVEDKIEKKNEGRIDNESALEEYFIDPIAALNNRAQTVLLEDIEPAVPDQSQPKRYPVESVWVLKKSKRIEEQSIYYIDHPEMGIMVTIKPFTPVPLNTPEQELEAPTEGFAQDIIPLPQG